MAKRGPKPKPTAVLKLRGSTLVTKRRERGEPKAVAGYPPAPDGLDDEARATWDDLLPMLDYMGVLTRIDGRALARYCVLWSRWRKVEADLAEHGMTYRTKQCIRRRPETEIAIQLASQLGRLEAEFGMTPSARTRIAVAPRKDSGENKARFFKSG